MLNVTTDFSLEPSVQMNQNLHGYSQTAHRLILALSNHANSSRATTRKLAYFI